MEEDDDDAPPHLKLELHALPDQGSSELRGAQVIFQHYPGTWDTAPLHRHLLPMRSNNVNTKLIMRDFKGSDL